MALSKNDTLKKKLHLTINKLTGMETREFWIFWLWREEVSNKNFFLIMSSVLQPVDVNIGRSPAW